MHHPRPPDSSVWIYIKRASVQYTAAVCMDLRQDEEMHGERQLFINLIQPTTAELWVLQSAAERIMQLSTFSHFLI